MTKISWPKKLGEAIDLFYRLRRDRLAVEKQVEVLKDRQKQLEEYLLQTFDKIELEGAKGKLATATIIRTEIADVVDWPLLWAHIRKTNNFDLLHKRVTVNACRERWVLGEVVPGVKRDERIGLSVVKASGKSTNEEK